MTITTLHYLFSSIPQILGATSAILFAVLFFRIDRITKCLIGDGKTIFRRNQSGETAYKVLQDWRIKRLEDAIDRESVSEIKEIIKYLNDTEIENKISKSQRPRGFQYLYQDRFLPTERYLQRLKVFTIITIFIKITTIIMSIIFLAFTDCIFSSNCRTYYIISIILLFSISLLLTVFLLIYSLQSRTVYEDLELRDKIIEENKENK